MKACPFPLSPNLSSTKVSVCFCVCVHVTELCVCLRLCLAFVHLLCLTVTHWVLLTVLLLQLCVHFYALNYSFVTLDVEVDNV